MIMRMVPYRGILLLDLSVEVRVGWICFKWQTVKEGTSPINWFGDVSACILIRIVGCGPCGVPSKPGTAPRSVSRRLR